MAKRIIAGILGTLAVFASLLPLGYAFLILKDFKNPDVSFWPNVLGELFTCAIALAGLWIGIRFLRFAWSGRSKQGDSLAKPLLLGIGFFFPAFIFSFPITILWVSRSWPGDNGKIDLALEVSAFVGAAAATICTILLIKKRALRNTS
jgi:hypothetical protein